MDAAKIGDLLLWLAKYVVAALFCAAVARIGWEFGGVVWRLM